MTYWNFLKGLILSLHICHFHINKKLQVTNPLDISSECPVYVSKDHSEIELEVIVICILAFRIECEGFQSEFIHNLIYLNVSITVSSQGFEPCNSEGQGKCNRHDCENSATDGTDTFFGARSSELDWLAEWIEKESKLMDDLH